MWISYGIISDKSIRITLNIFTRENKIFCFFPYYIFGLYFPEFIKDHE